MTQIHTMRVHKFLPSVSVFAVAAFLIVSPAMAGFEWKPPAKTVTPSENSANALMPEMPAMPRDSVETIDLQAAPNFPVISPRVEDAPIAPALTRAKPVLTDHPVSAAPASIRQVPSTISAPETTVPAADFSHEDYDAKPLAAPILTQANAVSSYDEIMGFGSDLPLALAMRQIVPAQYGYAFDSAVDQGARVTWNGGKPWDQVLGDAVAPLGLAVSIAEGRVHVLPAAKLAAKTPVVQMTQTPAIVTNTLAQTSEASREVYVRRNSTAEPAVQTRAPGQAETLSRGVVVTPQKKSSFWSHFGLDSAERTTLKDHNSALTPATSRETPHRVLAQAPLNQGLTASAPQGELVAQYHEPVSLTQPPGQTPAQNTAAMNPYVMSYWQAEKGDSLRNVLQSWSDDAGVRLYWVPASDYKLPEAIRLQGSYTDALTQILGAYNDAPARPVGRLHPNLPMGPSVLIIEPSSNS